MIVADIKLPYELVSRIYIHYFNGHNSDVRVLEDLTYGAIVADIFGYIERMRLTNSKENIYISYIVRE